MSDITEITVTAQDTRTDTAAEWFVPGQDVLDHINTLSDFLTVTISPDGLTRVATAKFKTLEKYVAYLDDDVRQKFVVDRETHNAINKISTVVTAKTV